MSPAIATSLRLPQELIDRADALAERMTSHTASGELVRSDVLRIALVRGLESLEAEHGGGKGSPSKNARKR